MALYCVTVTSVTVSGDACNKSILCQGFTKANMRLLWDKSDPMNVHPYKKGLALAKAMGVRIREASWGDGEMEETAAFCQSLLK